MKPTLLQHFLCAALFAGCFVTVHTLQAEGPASAAVSESGPAVSEPPASVADEMPRARRWAEAASANTGFEENKGQVRDANGSTADYVDFVLNRGNVSVFLLAEGGMAWQFSRMHYPEGRSGMPETPLYKMARGVDFDRAGSGNEEVRRETFRMDMVLEGANPAPNVRKEGQSADYTNYYNRNALGVFHYEKVTYEDVYPGIDWVVYTHENGLKYDFVVHPGADPGLIQLKFSHHESLYLDDAGNLVHGNRMGEITEKAPVSYQNGREIPTAFLLQGDVLGFQLGDYHSDEPLIVDPERIWSTYYGGAAEEEARSCAVDPFGNVYLAGVTQSAGGIADGGHQNTFAAEVDAFLVKFNETGNRLWGTYYGGEAVDLAYSCATDSEGNVFIAGETSSVEGIASDGHQNENGGEFDAFLVKFDASGTRIWGTYYGGSEPDGSLSCAVDSDDNVYLSGITSSGEGAIAFEGFQNTPAGGIEGFLVKFNPAGVRLWATYYGGGNDDFGTGCAVDPSGNVFLAGATASTFGIVDGGHQENYGGGDRDAFLVKFDSSGERLWATYYGGGNVDVGWGCTTDLDGNVFMSGITVSQNNIAFEGHQNNFSGLTSAFLVKFDPVGERLWGTYYGGTGSEFAYSCVTDAQGNVYMSGETNSNSGIASGGFQNAFGGGAWDGFLAKLAPSGERLWGSYFGGNGNDFAMSCAADGIGRVYLGGFTTSTFDIFGGGHQSELSGPSDAFLAMIEEEDFSIHTNNSAADGELFVFPNPSAEQVTLQVPEQSVGDFFRLFDITGKAVASGRVYAAQTSIDLRALSQGVYVLTLDALPGKGIRVVRE